MSGNRSEPSRESMLKKIREAASIARRYFPVREPGPRWNIGYQGAGGTDLVQGFGESLRRAGGHFHAAAQLLEVPRILVPILENAGVRRVGISAEPVLEGTLQLARRLHGFGLEVWQASRDSASEFMETKQALFALDAGITGVDALIAETGTIVLAASPQRPRSLSLLPPLYIALARADQIVPDLFDWFGASSPATPPSAFTFITGPSKTGDIELTLVTGVHGPGEVHVIVYLS
ncbi:Lactate utilization protein C [bacterium HR36]|nr:Lactate utilization protein C [bacterium HR36]